MSTPRPRRRAPCRGRSTARAWPRGTWRSPRARTASPATSPVDASTPLGTSHATTGASGAAVDRRDRARGRLARLAREAGAEDRVDDRGGAVQRPAASNGARRRRRAGARGWSRASPRSSSASAEQQHVDLAAALAQQPRGHQPVAAVVALAARRPRSRPSGASVADELGQPRAGALHQLERRDPALLDRPRVDGALCLGVGQRRRASPGARSSLPRSRTAAAPASRRCGSARPRPPRRAPPRARPRPPCRRTSGGAVAADHLDVAEAPRLEPQRLGHRLLGAEARRQVLAGPARAAA